MDNLEYMAKVVKMTEQAMCNHTNTETITKDGNRLTYCMECGDFLYGIAGGKCHFCGATENLVEGETRGESGRTIRIRECREFYSCLDRCIDQRSLPGYYRKSAELVK
jgi:hypothetical protein